MWPFKRKREFTAPAPVNRNSAFSTHGGYSGLSSPTQPIDAEFEQPTGAPDIAQDAGLIKRQRHGYGIPNSQAEWYVGQSFIGYHMAGHIAKNWLVSKACQMPARDAIRQGYRVDCEDPAVIERLDEASKDRNVDKAMRDLVVKGREMGGAAALFMVNSTDIEYYENPFNPDGVTEGNYRGIKIIDASWMTPDMTAANTQDPASPEFYNPTYWRIGTRRYHRSHFVFFVPYPVADLAKPMYNYWGVSVPERIYERVFAAERTANEAPQLAMTKRLLTIGIPDLAMADKDAIAENLEYFTELRNNYGVHVTDGETTMAQYDTALGDLDATIMTQYQLVAAGASVPATKLLGTTPKGFNSSGEYEEAVYREELESIQTNDLLPLLNRHYDMLLRHMGISDRDVTITWEALDSPTAKEWAEINFTKSQTAVNYSSAGAIDGVEIRNALAMDPDSDFYGLEERAEPDLSAYLEAESEPDEEQEAEGGADPEA